MNLCNYWLQSAALMQADVHPTERPWYGCPEVFEGSFEIELGYDHPDDYEGMGNRDYRKQFAKVMSGTGNGDTADAFLQCCLFGKVVYG